MYPKIQNDQSQDDSQAREFSRLLTAAIVNPDFRNLLLTNPPIALSNGYNGETFEFTSELRALIVSTQAKSLEDFVGQVIQYPQIDDQRNGNGEKPQERQGEGRHLSDKNPQLRREPLHMAMISR